MTGVSTTGGTGPLPLDLAIRLTAFRFLERLTQFHGEALPYQALAAGFEFEGVRVPLLGPQGIFKPQVMELPLSIMTSPPSANHPRPYDDGFEADGQIRYRYRGTDIGHRDNVGLREAMRRGTPLVYLHGLCKGKYKAVWPVVVVGDDPASLCFMISAEDHVHVLARLESGELTAPDPAAELRRRYVSREAHQRLHQAAFRERVLHAYRERCSVCRLQHPELLDAAHIIPDREETGEPVVSNGLSLCKLHHAAFDKNIMGIRPDYVVQVRQDVLEETDGPMLLHGLQGMHERKLELPSRRIWYPDRDRVEERYEAFRKAG
ncbi:MAG: HNH endonuclease [Deltaproteobacteria bacterium]|nr:HNH endonuclease [Deltaproteobacteria bacterium]